MIIFFVYLKIILYFVLAITFLSVLFH